MGENAHSAKSAKEAFAAKHADFAKYARNADGAVHVLGANKTAWPEGVKKFIAKITGKGAKKADDDDGADVDGDWLKKDLDEMERIEGQVGEEEGGDQNKWPAAVDNSINAKS